MVIGLMREITFTVLRKTYDFADIWVDLQAEKLLGAYRKKFLPMRIF